jgi:hypothetical protein
MFGINHEPDREPRPHEAQVGSNRDSTHELQRPFFSGISVQSLKDPIFEPG